MTKSGILVCFAAERSRRLEEEGGGLDDACGTGEWISYVWLFLAKMLAIFDDLLIGFLEQIAGQVGSVGKRIKKIK